MESADNSYLKVNALSAIE